MRRLAICALALMAAGCSAERIFRTAQNNTRGFRVETVSEGNFTAKAGTEFAYIEGSGSAAVRAIWDGSIIWDKSVSGEVSKAWQLRWSPERKRPEVIEVEIIIAKNALDGPPEPTVQ